jgi:uncharacterized RDD family membrane protein YckC
MNMTLKQAFFSALFAPALFAMLGSFPSPALAQQADQAQAEQATSQEQAETTTPSLEVEAQSTSPDESESTELEIETETETETEERHRSGPDRQAIVHFGGDSHLAANEAADAVVSIFGSSTSEGEVREGVVSVFGDTRVTGSAHEVVSVFGDTYVNGRVHGQVVAAFGNLELGPEADISGEVVAIGGSLIRHRDAVVRGGIEEVSFGGDFVQLRWLRPWFEECFLLGRPLAPVDGIEWAWWLAAAFLALYVLLALMFSAPIERCVRTLEDYPGESTLTALISVFLVPVVFILLCVTVIGIVLVPFFGLALFAAGLVGKAVVLGAIGRRITRLIDGGPFAHIAFAVLIGGLIVTAMYMVPVLGFITYNLTGILGFGVLIYTFMLAARDRRERAAVIAPEAAPAAATAAATPAAVYETPAPDSLDASADTASAATAERPSEPMVPPTTLPRADFMVRMGALLIDAILVGIVANLIPGSGDIWLLALATYGAMMWKLKGTTVGGIICNLRVVRLDGRDMDWPTSIVRALGCFLSLFAAFLGFIWIIFDPDRQAWHDKIAGTVVVRAPKSRGLV